MTQLMKVSSIFRNAGWSMIPESFFELKRGLDLERERLRGRPWLALLKRDEIESDGSRYDRIELMETFDQEEVAIEAAGNRLVAALEEDRQVRFGNREWRVVASGPEVKAFTMQAEKAGRLISNFHYGYKLMLGDFNIRYCVAHVVRVDPDRVIDDDLFDWLGAEQELIGYLCEKGKVQGGVAVAG